MVSSLDLNIEFGAYMIIWKSQCAANECPFIESSVGEKIMSEEAFSDLVLVYLITTCKDFEQCMELHCFSIR